MERYYFKLGVCAVSFNRAVKTHTAATMHPDIGKRGLYLGAHPLAFEVTILDVKSAWGQLRYLVTPVAGEGQVWTTAVTIYAPDDYGRAA